MKNRSRDMDQPKKSPYPFFAIGAVFLAVCGTVVLYLHFDRTPAECYLLAINFTGFVAMGYDKGAARAGALRIPESILYLLAVVGGSAGVILGMHYMRHKTRTAHFQLLVTSILIFQLVILHWFGIIGPGI